MARRSWMKYLGITAAFAGVGLRVYSWVNSAQAPNSDEGEDISAAEIAALSPVITDAINQGLVAADVPLMVAPITLIPME